jgi:putative ABC transport system permease protein
MQVRVSDIFRLAFKALVDRKLRSVLTILGIMVGSAIILALIASSSGLSAGVQSQVNRIGANTLTVMSARQFFVSGGGAQTSFQLSQDDVNTMKSFQGVSDVIPYYSRGATITVGGTSIQGSLTGVDPSVLFKMYQGLGLYDGSLPDPYDPTAAAIGYAIAFPPGSTSQLADVSQMVSVTLGSSKTSLNFLVKGVLAQYGSVLMSNIDDTIFISLESAQILLKTPYFTGMYVITDTPDDVAAVQQEIESYYGTQVRVISAGAILSSVESITSQMTVFLGSIGGVTMFVAAVGITNTMFVSVMERTREIGILKALGYRPKQIMSMFLSEAALTGVIGAVLGTLLGYALSFIIGGDLPLSGGVRFFGGGGGGATLSPVFSPELIVFSLLFPVGIALVAGLYPAWRAARMNAVVALKYE